MRRARSQRVVNGRGAISQPVEGGEASSMPRAQAQTSYSHEFRIDKAVRAAEVLGCQRFCDITANPTAPAWLETLEQAASSAGWTDGQTYEVAKFLLSDNVKAWWNGEMRGSSTVLGWNDFKTKFMERYYTPFHRTQEMRQFLTLEQGDQSVVEYLSQFYDSARSMGSLQHAPEVLRHQFIEGLRPSLRSRLVVLPNATLTDLAQLAMQQEEFEHAYQTPVNPPPQNAEKQKKKGFWGKLIPFKGVNKKGQGNRNTSPARGGSSSGFSSGRQSFYTSRFQPGRQSFQGTAQARPNLDRSQSMRTEPGSQTCYGCRQKGHFVRDCPFIDHSAVAALSRGGHQFQGGRQGTFRGGYNAPRRNDVGTSARPSTSQPAVQTRAYHLNAEDAQGNPNLISGTLLVFGMPARVLIDWKKEPRE